MKTSDDEPDDLNSPEMLSTLLTTMVHKYGTAKLSAEDFKNVASNEYISIYIDTTTNELILSLNHYMQDDAPLVVPGFEPGDDETYH